MTMTGAQCEWMTGNSRCGDEAKYIADTMDTSYPPLQICENHRERISDGENIRVKRLGKSSSDYSDNRN